MRELSVNDKNSIHFDDSIGHYDTIRIKIILQLLETEGEPEKYNKNM